MEQKFSRLLESWASPPHPIVREVQLSLEAGVWGSSSWPSLEKPLQSPSQLHRFPGSDRLVLFAQLLGRCIRVLPARVAVLKGRRWAVCDGFVGVMVTSHRPVEYIAIIRVCFPMNLSKIHSDKRSTDLPYVFPLASHRSIHSYQSQYQQITQAGFPEGVGRKSTARGNRFAIEGSPRLASPVLVGPYQPVV